MRGRSLALLFILASLAASLAPAGSAGAAFGDLSFLSCLSAGGKVAGCAAGPEDALEEPFPIAVSADGRSVYVGADEGAALTHLTRSGDGSLGFDSCFSIEEGPDCVFNADMPIGAAQSIAVSADDRSLYLASVGEQAVAYFNRTEQLGALSYAGCVSSLDSQVTCDLVPEEPFRGAAAVAVDPLGRSVYLAAAAAGTFSVLPRDPVGQVAFERCFANDATDGCVPLPGDPLNLPSGIDVSPDGRSIYVSGGRRIAWFERTSSGETRFVGCFVRAPTEGTCAEVPGGAMREVADVAVSPDGTSVYAISRNVGAILHFSRAAGGALAYRGCLANDDAAGCLDLPGGPLTGAEDVAVSSDGRSVYVAATGAGAIVEFARAADGALAFGGCVAQAEVPVSGCTLLPAGVMELPVRLAVSPDGSSVHVTAHESGTVVTFARSQAEEPPPSPPAAPRPPGLPQAPCAGRPATIVGTDGADVLRGTPRRDVIAALGGADTIRGRGGADLICGGAGRDAIFGGGGRDRILGEAGVDRCLDGPGRDRVKCERGRGRRG